MSMKINSSFHLSTLFLIQIGRKLETVTLTYNMNVYRLLQMEKSI